MATIRNLIIHGQFNASGITAGARQAAQAMTNFVAPLEKLHGSAGIGIAELARGIGKVAQAGTVGAFAMREFTGAAFRLSAFLGPVGPLIPIIGLLGYALYEIFHKTREEIDKTRKKFEEDLKAMVDAADTAALNKQIHDLIAGTPSQGFQDSLQARRDQLAREEATLATLRAAVSGDDLKHAKENKKAYQEQIQVVNRLSDALDLYETDIQRVRSEIERTNNVPFEIKGAPANKLTVDSPTRAIQRQAEAAEKLVSMYDTLTKRHEGSLNVSRALLTAYDRVTRSIQNLRAQGKGMFDPMIESLTKAQEALEKTDIVELLRLGRIPVAPAVAVTPAVGLGPTGRGLQLPAGIAPDEFVKSAAMQSAEAIREALVDILSRGVIRPATGLGGGALSAAPAGGAITRLDVLRAQFEDFFSNIGNTITGELLASFGPIAILMRALEPALRALTPLFDRLAVPVAMVARILVAQLEPILRALWPILRLLGIVATLIGEVIARASAAIAQAVGGLIKAIGNLIAKIPGLGGVGHAIANFGQSMLNFAEGSKQAADEFARTRHELQGMTWNDTAAALENLQGAANATADALTNIPSTLKINRAIFLATQPVNPQAITGTPGAGGGQSNYFAPGSIVIVGSDKTGAQLLDEVSTAARQKSMARTGTTADAAKVIG